MSIPKYHRLKIGTLARDLPVTEVAPGLKIAVLNLLGDYELARAAAKALAKRMPAATEILMMPEGKALGLLQALQEETGLSAVVPRKRETSYMSKPVLVVNAVSITTQTPHSFNLGAEDVAKLKGKHVVILDDVVSSGGTVKAMRKMLERAKAFEAGVMAIATEGDALPGVIALDHLTVYKTP